MEEAWFGEECGGRKGRSIRSASDFGHVMLTDASADIYRSDRSIVLLFLP